MFEIPKYQCHKKVSAFEIGKIEGTVIHSLNGKCDPIDVGPEFITRHPLNLPGYLVFYKDGYRSYSPKIAFEQGYTKIS